MDDTTNRPPAIVTSASSGIGFEPAKQFAGNGFDLLIAADDKDDPVSTKAQGRFGRLLPDSAKAEMHRKLAEPGSAKR